MKLRIGYELIYDFPQPTPVILAVNVHSSRANDLIVPDELVTEPKLTISGTTMLLATDVTASSRPRDEYA